MLNIPGPRKMFRPASPNVYWAFGVKAAVLNHSVTVGFARCQLPTRLGRSVCPVLEGSEETVGFRGNPEFTVTIEPRLHPPNAASSVRFQCDPKALLFPKGRS